MRFAITFGIFACCSGLYELALLAENVNYFITFAAKLPLGVAAFCSIEQFVERVVLK